MHAICRHVFKLLHFLTTHFVLSEAYFTNIHWGCRTKITIQ